MKLKHSKYKNTGILFELLTRQLTSDTITGSDSKSLSFLKKHFNSKTELSKELKLYMQEGESITLLRVLNYIFFIVILSFSLIVSFYSTSILSEFIISKVNKYTENILFPLALKEVSETTVFLTFLIGLLSLIINSYKIASKIYNFPRI